MSVRQRQRACEGRALAIIVGGGVVPILDPYGLRRVVSPRGALPQAADTLNPLLPLGDDELEIDVEQLNIDAASFRQLESVEHTDEKIAGRIAAIVAARGKMQNPVTGSGGMLLGRVRTVGANHPAQGQLKPGDRIATLVSLTLTPLVIEKIHAVHRQAERVDITGRAILFASGAYARLPTDLPETVALAVLDVCGAPAWAVRLVRPGATVVVLGAGKSGSLVCAAARAQQAARIIVLDRDASAPQRLVDAGLADIGLAADATQPTEILRMVEAATGGALADLVVSCTSVPGAEMSCILSARQGGEVLFFSMATSFSAAALGAEGVGKDLRLYVGNGFALGHAGLALQMVREHSGLRALFERRVG
jgi:L-erythro-3,5-diaminohexanoate dehydrogenase